MPIANITIDSYKTQEADYVNFKDKSQKSWNCNRPELIQMFAVGERYHIDYNETQPKPGRKFGSKYINRARPWKPEDGANTWPDKEPYTGGSNYGGGKSMGKDFDPETSKTQTCINASAVVYANTHEALDLDQFKVEFPVLVEIMHSCFQSGVQSGASGSGSSPVSESDDDGIDF